MIVTNRSFKKYEITLRAWNGKEWWGDWEELLVHDIHTLEDVYWLSVDIKRFNDGDDLNWFKHRPDCQQLRLTVQEVQ